MNRLFGKKKKRNHASDEVSLQITSMADIFTILLVFLLKGVSTNAMNITPSANMRIPAAQGESIDAESLKLEISENAVMLEGAPVVTLKQFRFEGGAAGKSAADALNAALKKERDRQALIAKSNEDVKIDPKIILLSDERVPYSTIKTVLATAAMHGYTEVKLAVVKDE